MSTASPRAQPQALFKFCHVFLLGELWASKARSALCRSMRLDYLSHVPECPQQGWNSWFCSDSRTKSPGMSVSALC